MTYDELLLDDTTRLLLTAYLKSPTHALLLSGETGVGLGTIAKTMAQALVESSTDIQLITPDEKGTISIETVRSLYVMTRTARASKQVVVLDDIDAMSHDAQNAFLKLLEEPTEQSFFITTSHAVSALLPTIQSRAQIVEVRPVSAQKSEEFLLSTLHQNDARVRQQCLFLALGKPAELTRLSNDQAHFESQTTLVVDSRTLLAGTLFERLSTVARYTDRTQALQLLETLCRLVSFSLKTKPSQQLINASEVIELVTQRLSQNGNIRAQLLYLAQCIVK